MKSVPDEVQKALGVLMLHGAPVSEQEYRKIIGEAEVTVSAGYLMMRGYLKQSRPVKEERPVYHRYITGGEFIALQNQYELTPLALEAFR
jgi:hypothetical protein